MNSPGLTDAVSPGEMFQEVFFDYNEYLRFLYLSHRCLLPSHYVGTIKESFGAYPVP